MNDNIALAARLETFQQWPTSHASWVETRQWAERGRDRQTLTPG